MARSKVTTPSGKKVTPKKKRDKTAQASIHILTTSTESNWGSKNSRYVHKKNDGDPKVYRRDRKTKVADDGKAKTVSSSKSTTLDKAAANPNPKGTKGFKSTRTHGKSETPAQRATYRKKAREAGFTKKEADKLRPKPTAKERANHKSHKTKTASEEKKYGKPTKKTYNVRTSTTETDSKGRKKVVKYDDPYERAGKKVLKATPVGRALLKKVRESNQRDIKKFRKRASKK
jgi:hypothetical protein